MMMLFFLISLVSAKLIVTDFHQKEDELIFKDKTIIGNYYDLQGHIITCNKLFEGIKGDTWYCSFNLLDYRMDKDKDENVYIILDAYKSKKDKLDEYLWVQFVALCFIAIGMVSILVHLGVKHQIRF